MTKHVKVVESKLLKHKRVKMEKSTKKHKKTRFQKVLDINLKKKKRVFIVANSQKLIHLEG